MEFADTADKNIPLRMKIETSPEGGVAQYCFLLIRFTRRVAESVDIDLGGGCLPSCFPTAAVGPTVARFPATFFISVRLFIEESGSRPEVGSDR